MKKKKNSPGASPSAQDAGARFDAAYYRRFYFTRATRAMSREETQTRGALIAALVKQLDIPVKRILDVGCGLGWYARPLLKTFRDAEYVGAEISEHLCAKHGWTHGSIVDLKLKGQFDLIICADVVQYLNDADAARAIANLAKWCRGALYFHAPTQRDWRDNVDHAGTDANVHLRSASWYRKQLRKEFIHAGSGVHVKASTPFAQWELEEPWR